MDCARAAILLPLGFSILNCKPVNKCSLVETAFLLLVTVSTVNLVGKFIFERLFSLTFGAFLLLLFSVDDGAERRPGDARRRRRRGRHTHAHGQPAVRHLRDVHDMVGQQQKDTSSLTQFRAFLCCISGKLFIYSATTISFSRGKLWATAQKAI